MHERPGTHALAEPHEWGSATGICQWGAAICLGCGTLEQETATGFLFVGKLGRSPPFLPSYDKRVSQSPTNDGI